MTPTTTSPLVARVQAALAPLGDAARLRISPAENGVVVTVDRSYCGGACIELLRAGLWADHRPRDRILVTDDTDWYPRHRRAPSELDPDALTIAWAVRAQFATGPLYTHMWRHVLECDSYQGSAEFGTGSDGACDTCFHSYPAVLWWVHCGCGLLRLGTETAPWQHALNGYDQTLPALLDALAQVRSEYLSADLRHEAWMPGLSRRRRAT